MKRFGVGLLCSALLLPLVAVSAAPAKPDGVRIDTIRAHFLYQTTGGLSEDVMPPSKFAIWNTVIGEGSAKEPADDVLVGVVLKTASDELNAQGTLIVTVRGDKGKVLATRKFEGLFFKHGTTVRYLLAPDIACVGPIKIEASYGTQKKTAKVDMACGE